METEDIEVGKKPRGWWAQLVKQLAEDLNDANARMDEIDKTVRNLPGLEHLLEHPMVKDYATFEKRLRQMESIWQTMVADLRTTRNDIANLKNEIQQLQRRATRGA